jgi:hypothetical protein
LCLPLLLATIECVHTRILVPKGSEITQFNSFAGGAKAAFNMSKRKSDVAFSIDSFLNDSDVDEDDLLLMKPSGLKKVTSPTSTTNMEHCSESAAVVSQEESSANSPSSDTNSPRKVHPSEEDLDQEGTLQEKESRYCTVSYIHEFPDSLFFLSSALKEARRIFQFQTDYLAIHSTALLKWYAVPVKGKKKGRNKYSNIYPCYICPNREQAMAGHEDEVQFNQRNDTLIRYMGYQVSYRNQIQAVPAAHLLNFNHHQSIDGNSAEEECCNTWCPSFMKMFLNSLYAQQEFKVAGSEYERKLKIKVEEKLLDLVLISVLELEQKLPAGDTVNSSIPDDTNCDDEPTLDWQSPAKLDEGTADYSPAIIQEREKSDGPSVKDAPKRLRAGDIIECW